MFKVPQPFLEELLKIMSLKRFDEDPLSIINTGIKILDILQEYSQKDKVPIAVIVPALFFVTQFLLEKLVDHTFEEVEVPEELKKNLAVLNLIFTKSGDADEQK